MTFWTARTRPSPASPVEPKPNTLYAGVPGQDRISLLYRIYLPDNGRDLTGGAKALERPFVWYRREHRDVVLDVGEAFGRLCNVQDIGVTTADKMLAACEAALPADVFIAAAAVAMRTRLPREVRLATPAVVARARSST